MSGSKLAARVAAWLQSRLAYLLSQAGAEESLHLISFFINMFHQTLASSNMLSQRVQRGDCYISSLTLYSDGADGQRFAALYAPGRPACSAAATSAGILTEHQNLGKCQIKGRLLTRSFDAHVNICVSTTWMLWKNLRLSRRPRSLANTFDATSSVPRLNVTEERPECVCLQT